VANQLDPGEVLTVWDQGFGAFGESQEVMGGEEGNKSTVRDILDELSLHESVERRRRRSRDRLGRR